jgi:hypothetical protein
VSREQRCAEPLELNLNGIKAWLVTVGPVEEPFPYLLIEADEPLRTLNSAPWGGGFGAHRLLVNRQVATSYDYAEPDAEMAAFLRRQRSFAPLRRHGDRGRLPYRSDRPRRHDCRRASLSSVCACRPAS